MLYLNSIFSNAQDFSNLFSGSAMPAISKQAFCKRVAAYRRNIPLNALSGLSLHALGAAVEAYRDIDLIVERIGLSTHGQATAYLKADNTLCVNADATELVPLESPRVEDDPALIRYRKVSDGKIYRCKIGKFLQKTMQPHVDRYGAKAVNYFIEIFTEKWKAAGLELTSRYELKQFGEAYDIYNSSMQEGDFHSCMNDTDYPGDFYDSNTEIFSYYGLFDNESDKLVARCLVINATDQVTNEVVRLAERQYSSNTDLKLQRILVNKLIAANLIDGFKRIGAGCRDSQSFISNTGETWDDRKFFIRPDMEVVSIPYMDSFKYLDSEDGVMYNHTHNYYNYELTGTDGNSEALEDLVEYYYWEHGSYHRAKESRAWVDNNCVEINDEYYLDYEKCFYCGEYIRKDEGLQSADGHYFCDEDCAASGDYYLCEDSEEYEHIGNIYEAEDMDGDTHYYSSDEELIEVDSTYYVPSIIWDLSNSRQYHRRRANQCQQDYYAINDKLTAALAEIEELKAKLAAATTPAEAES